METIDNISLKSPYEILSLSELRIENKVNCHAKVYFTGIVSEEKKDDYIKMASSQDKIEVNHVDKGSIINTLFKGIVSNIKIKAVMGVYYIEVEGISHSFDLDLKLKCLSFQNKNMPYSQLIKSVISGYAGCDFIDEASKGATLGKLVVQYNETDWQFLKRMASQFGAPLVPDITSDTPKFWFGMPVGKEVGNLDNFNYSVKKDLCYYMDTAENYNNELQESDFICYEIESEKFLNIGDKVSFQGKELIVGESIVVLDKAVLKYGYVLTAEGIGQNLILNRSISGAALEGKIIDVQKDTVKIHLDIDKEQNKAEACWFPYSTFYTSEGNGGWYCMPELGDSVKLYFPNSIEDDAMAISSVRKGGHSCEKMADPDIKYIGTSNGKEVKLGGDDLVLTAKADMFIKLHEGDGIEIQSDQPIVFQSKGDMVIDATKLDIVAKDGVTLVCGNNTGVICGGNKGDVPKESVLLLSGSTSSIAMIGDLDIKGTKVKMEGTQKLPVKVEEAVEKETKDKINMGMDYLQLGLSFTRLRTRIGSNS